MRRPRHRPINRRRLSGTARFAAQAMPMWDIPATIGVYRPILREEVALKYGYSADQRVVNVVLRTRFRAVTLEAGDSLSTDGGSSTPTGHVDGLKISRANRINLDL